MHIYYHQVKGPGFIIFVKSPLS